MKIRNKTQERLGWHGLTIEPNAEVDVPDHIGEAMLTRSSANFELVVDKKKATK